MKTLVVLSSFFLLAAFFGCALKSAPVEKTQAPEVITPEVKSVEKESWQVEWEKALAEARKERRVVVLTGVGPTTRVALSRKFNANYGIDVEFIPGTGAEITAKVFNERRAGLYLVDLYFSGSTTPVTLLKPAGVFEALEPLLILPEVIDPKAWWQERLPFIDKDRKIFSFAAFPSSYSLFRNTEMVKENEVKSYRDLLNPKWKGKIVMQDPTVTGSGLQVFSVVGEKILGYDYWRQFVKQEPLILRDARLEVEWVAKGRYAIGVGGTDIMYDFQQAGAPLDGVVPEEGHYISSSFGNLAFFNQSPHPRASKIFINWLLSREGQEAWARASGFQSARKDIPVDYLDPVKVRKPGVKYIAVDEEDFLLKRTEIQKVAREIFGPLLR